MALKEFAITVAIAVLFSTFVIVAVDAFYERPEYRDFCDTDVRAPLIKDAECDYEQTQQEIDCIESEGQPVYEYVDGCRQFSSCSECSHEYDNARDKYSRNIFFIVGFIGLVAIIFGVYFKIDFIGSGFMYSGIFLMFYATVQNFENLGKFVRVGVILLELILVLFIAFKKVVPLSDQGKDRSRK